MALQTLEGDLIPMRPAKETLTRYAVLLLGAAILSFGLFNVHSQSGVTEGGVLGTTLLLHHWFGISPGVSELIPFGIRIISWHVSSTYWRSSK